VIVFLVVLGGGAGALARFVLDEAARSRAAVSFPWPTVLINVTGSLVLGFLVGLAVFGDAPTTAVLVSGIGFCGGYTTFSTASFETVRLLQRGRYLAAAANAFGTPLLAIGAGALGLLVAHW